MNAGMNLVADEYVRTVNRGDAAGFLALFADDATVSDAGRAFRGRDAIEHWSRREIFEAKVTLGVMDDMERDGETVVTTRVDGAFDKTGLPDPVVIVHRFVVEGERIASLSCQLGE